MDPSSGAFPPPPPPPPPPPSATQTETKVDSPRTEMGELQDTKLNNRRVFEFLYDCMVSCQELARVSAFDKVFVCFVYLFIY